MTGVRAVGLSVLGSIAARWTFVAMGCLAPPASAAYLRSAPTLGIAEGRCRANEPGPAITIIATGLKDRAGLLRAELYPPDDAGFLADDDALLSSGRTFRRAEIVVPAQGPARLCLRAPRAGMYTLALVHDRIGDHKFSLLRDGIGFAGNPRLGYARPHAAAALVRVPDGMLALSIVLNYRHGMLGFGPLAPDR